MPYTTLVSGTTITASWANASVRDQVVTPFASTAARDSAITVPVTGMAAYISSNNSSEGLTTYTSAAAWRAPWNLPWGAVAAPASNSSLDLTLGAIADITSLSVTWTAVANRRYKITAQCGHYDATGAGLVQFDITDGANNLLNAGVFRHSATNAETAVLSAFWSPSAGSQTAKLRGTSLIAAGTNKAYADASYGAFISVEDIGPSGAPA